MTEVKDIVNKQKIFAIVGATNNPVKYGHIVFNDLKSAGFKVIPINLHENEVLGLPAFQKLADVPEKIDTVVMIIPPPAALSVLKEAKELGIKIVWFQPGSESEEAIKYCGENGLECVHDQCIMVARRSLGL